MVQFRPLGPNYGTIQPRITVQFGDLRYISDDLRYTSEPLPFAENARSPRALWPAKTRPEGWRASRIVPSEGELGLMLT